MPVAYKKWVIKVETFKDIRLKGREMVRIKKPDVVVILPILNKNRVLLEKHYRPVIKKTILELPAGHIDRGETPVQAARRELFEETGYSAKTIELAFKSFDAPGLLSSRVYTFIAEGVYKTGAKTDKHEPLHSTIISTSTAFRFIKNNTIEDNKTISALLFYEKFINNK